MPRNNFAVKANPDREEMIALYLSGMSQRAIADRFGIAQSRVSRIFLAAGVRLSEDERRKRQAEATRRYMSDPVNRAYISERLRNAWKAGRSRTGRAPLFSEDPTKRELYLLLRAKVGAAEARRMISEAS